MVQPLDPPQLTDHSFVSPLPPDLFVRLRAGFRLEDVDELQIDRELNWYANHPDYLERVWGRAEHYLHYIVGQLNERSMPLELALLPVVESAFEPYAYSRARAAGLWQFIPGTGSRFGLKQDWWYDGRRDIVESTRAALDYLQYLHYIIAQLNERNMPLELALLPVVESAFEPYAYSRARASGLWQFIPGTGSRYGLKQDWWYDGRRDVVASTRAALDYLQSLHDEFNGDWLLAIAAYNCGEGNVQHAVNRNQRAGRPIDFWHLKLPTETRAYVPKLLAMRRIVADPANFGLEFSQIPDEPYFTPVATGGQIDLQVVAEITGISKEDLYELNPAFHRFATDPTGPHSLLVPTKIADGLEQMLLSLTPEQRMRVAAYTVRRGDTVASIAAAFATTPATLRQLNDMGTNEKPVIGNDLRVPSANVPLPEKAARAAALFDRPGRMGGRRHFRVAGVRVVRRGDTLARIAHRTGTDVRTLARLNNMEVGDPLRAGQRLVISASTRSGGSAAHGTAASGQSASGSGSGRPVTYTVRRGDTLYSIARLLQVTVRDLMGWNGVGSANALHPGQKLVAFVSSRG